MFTPYAVMSWNERYVAKTLLAGRELTTTYDRHCRTRMLNKKWITYAYVEDGTAWNLTVAGKVAYELREILGPDRELTKAQAGLVAGKFGLTPAMKRKLQESGLIKRHYMGYEEPLTEDGQKIKTVLHKYGVRF